MIYHNIFYTHFIAVVIILHELALVHDTENLHTHTHIHIYMYYIRRHRVFHSFNEYNACVRRKFFFCLNLDFFFFWSSFYSHKDPLGDKVETASEKIIIIKKKETNENP